MHQHQPIHIRRFPICRWNDQYGEGGSRRKEQLAYYT